MFKIKNDTKAVAALGAFISSFLWSTAFVAIKIGYKYYSGQFTFAGIRFFLAGVILLLFSIKNVRMFFKNFKVLFLIGFFQIFIGYAVFYTALKYIDATVSSIIVGGSPVTTALVSHIVLKDDKLSKNKIISLLLGFAGILVVVAGTAKGGSGTSTVFLISLVSVFLLILNQVINALVNIFVAKKSIGINPIIINGGQLFIGGGLLIILGYFAKEEQNFMQFETPLILSLAWLVFVSTFAFTIWYTILQKKLMTVSELNIWKFITPVSGAILAFFLLHEIPNVYTVIGLLLVVLSLFFNSRNQKEIK
ncbi:MAG: DMT family transporter [Sebaldella sp.]|nr:DMT family transporter [Sebaldella sp.]